MSLNDQLATDMRDIFCNTGDFGESVTYIKRDGTSRTITAQVFRETAESITPGQAAINRIANKKMYVPNNATYGIASTELDVGSDRVQLAEDETGKPTAIVKVISADAGGLLLQLR